MCRAALHLTPCANSLLSHLAARWAGTGEPVCFLERAAAEQPIRQPCPRTSTQGFATPASCHLMLAWTATNMRQAPQRARRSATWPGCVSVCAHGCRGSLLCAHPCPSLLLTRPRTAVPEALAGTCANTGRAACRRNARLLQKQRQVDGDEWARIHAFQCEEVAQQGAARRPTLLLSVLFGVLCIFLVTLPQWPHRRAAEDSNV